MAGKIVVVGSSNTDMILRLNRIPKPGETLLGGEFSMAAGGKGANQAVAAARAGGDVAFLARVGDDLFGGQAIEGFRREGIDVDHVQRDPKAASGVALIFVADDGENSIGVASGANGRLTPADVDAAAETIRSASTLVVQLETPLETVARAVEVAAAAGVRVILNPAPAQPLSDELLSRVSILTPNETEAALLTGRDVSDTTSAAAAAESLRARGVATAIVTLGAQGCVVASDEHSGHLPALSVEAVDTTAAGDVFNGALAVALAESAPLQEAICFASAAAALSVGTLGAQPSAPNRNAIERTLKNG